MDRLATELSLYSGFRARDCTAVADNMVASVEIEGLCMPDHYRAIVDSHRRGGVSRARTLISRAFVCKNDPKPERSGREWWELSQTLGSRLPLLEHPSRRQVIAPTIPSL